MSIFPLTLLMKKLHVVFPISMKKEKKRNEKRTTIISYNNFTLYKLRLKFN